MHVLVGRAGQLAALGFPVGREDCPFGREATVLETGHPIDVIPVSARDDIALDEVIAACNHDKYLRRSIGRPQDRYAVLTASAGGPAGGSAGDPRATRCRSK